MRGNSRDGCPAWAVLACEDGRRRLLEPGIVYPSVHNGAVTLDPGAVRHGRVRGRYFRENFAQGGIDLVQIVPEQGG